MNLFTCSSYPCSFNRNYIICNIPRLTKKSICWDKRHLTRIFLENFELWCEFTLISLMVWVSDSLFKWWPTILTINNVAWNIQESHGVVIDEVMYFLPQLRNRRRSGAFEWTARPWRCSASCGFWPWRSVLGIRWLGQHLPYMGRPIKGWRMNQTVLSYFFSIWASNILDSDAHRYRCQIDCNQFLDKRVNFQHVKVM